MRMPPTFSADIFGSSKKFSRALCSVESIERIEK